MAHARLIFRVVALVAVAATFGCGAGSAPAAPPPRPAAPPPAPRAEPVGIKDRAWGLAVSKRYSLSVSLPEREAWRDDDWKEPWWTLRHAESRSELRARTWRASRLSTAKECREQLRLWLPTAPDPEKAPESVIERRVLDAPSGYSTELAIGVRRTGQGSEIEGYALALGHTIGECYAALYTTKAGGKAAESTVGERLALITEGVLPRVARRGIEDRVR